MLPTTGSAPGFTTHTAGKVRWPPRPRRPLAPRHPPGGAGTSPPPDPPQGRPPMMSYPPAPMARLLRTTSQPPAPITRRREPPASRPPAAPRSPGRRWSCSGSRRHYWRTNYKSFHLGNKTLSANHGCVLA
ncbi:hypothetical protein E2C01_063793 [Portunus trituberculatus]|uniref:Uncharacterized protein n=1 Tax=Portunus trituberculatus TaxID=210409 RepID=A0A5B7HI18_PORTR|nr:hypothetical protein [Portunus trituberculatus]